MANYLRGVISKETPQTEPVFGEDQSKNNAGGYVYEVDEFVRMERFLVLGTEGGTFYSNSGWHEVNGKMVQNSHARLTLENAKAVQRAIELDGPRVVETITIFSSSGRIPKNSTALFCLAMCMAYGDNNTKRLANVALPKVARTGSHLLEFVSYVDDMRSWGRALRRGVGNWYFAQSADDIAFQVLKYRNRGGWTHRDVLRSAHPNPRRKLLYTHTRTALEQYKALATYIAREEISSDDIPHMVRVFQRVQASGPEAVDTETLVNLIHEYNLPWEMTPSDRLKEKEVWAALADHMPPWALIRNLANLTRVGVIEPLGDRVEGIVEKITNRESLKRARVHPVQVLGALLTYKEGRSQRGSSKWTPVPQIIDALEKALMLSFDFVEPTNSRYYIGVDVSSSMTWGTIAGMPSLAPNVGAAVMALAIAKAEPNYYIAGFSHEMRRLNITASDTIDSVQRRTDSMSFGSTDCALPMLDAIEKNLKVDCFVVITDNETWSGSMHPVQALRKYRAHSGINAKLAVIAMTATEFTIADPKDAGSLDIVGFDTLAPRILADFARA